MAVTDVDSWVNNGTWHVLAYEVIATVSGTGPSCVPCYLWRLSRSVYFFYFSLVSVFWFIHLLYFQILFKTFSVMREKGESDVIVLLFALICKSAFCSRPDSLRFKGCCFGCQLGYVSVSVIHRTLTWTTGFFNVRMWTFPMCLHTGTSVYSAIRRTEKRKTFPCDMMKCVLFVVHADLCSWLGL